MTTGERIRAARKKAGLTQVELAARLGVPYQSVGQWERDVRRPKLQTLQRIALALGTYVSEIVETGYWSTITKEEAEASWADGTVGRTLINSDTDPQIRAILANAQKLNAQGLAKLEEYSDDLVSSGKYEKATYKDGAV